jgi:hypothetical protein
MAKFYLLKKCIGKDTYILIGEKILEDEDLAVFSPRAITLSCCYLFLFIYSFLHLLTCVLVLNMYLKILLHFIT